MRRSIAAMCVAALVSGVLAAAGAHAAAAAPMPANPAAGTEIRGDQALAEALAKHPAAVAASGSDAFSAYRTIIDPDGAAHVRYTRTYRGLPVRGGDLVVHTTPDGSFAGASSALARPLSLEVRPTVGAAAARQAAQAHFLGTVTRLGSTELLIDATGTAGTSGAAAALAWETVVEGVRPDGVTPSKLHVLIDALTGTRLGSADDVVFVNGTGNSIYAGTVTIQTTLSGNYVMIDPSHGNGNTCDMLNGTSTCTNFTDADNVWGNGTQSNRQSAGVDAHYGAALTYDYYKIVHGRKGIFGNGAGVPSRVHYGNNYVNAFWDGTQMTYGDGAGNAKPLVSIDVAGHEMTHGVTAALAGLIYSGESGGLNEATSDIFGNMVEFYAGNAKDPGDYTVGEKIDINGNGTPLRYMYNPPLDGASHGCWSTNTQNVDVHYSSGVGNHFFFNLAQGTGATIFGTSPVCGGAPAVVGVGRAKAEKIWYRALDVYFTSTTRYVNTTNPANTARAYTLSAATDLYGRCSTVYRAVQAAWTAVNVAGSDSACSVPTSSTLQGACLEGSCIELGGAYISHFTNLSCTGVESYYTPYFSSDGIRRSWDGRGAAGTVLRTVTNRSWKDSSGVCHNDWPNGNTLSDFVTIYRTSCGEVACTPVTAAYISHFTNLSCTGVESYYTPYFSSDGVRRSWNGTGRAGTVLRTVTNRSWKDSGGVCHNDWPNGNTLSGFVTIYRTVNPCNEVTCETLGGGYISHFTNAGCTGVESYYTPYFATDGVRRSWNGTGRAGTVLRTVTNRSWKDSSGVCHNDWPNGNTLSGFVTIYR